MLDGINGSDGRCGRLFYLGAGALRKVYHSSEGARVRGCEGTHAHAPMAYPSSGLSMTPIEYYRRRSRPSAEQDPIEPSLRARILYVSLPPRCLSILCQATIETCQRNNHVPA